MKSIVTSYRSAGSNLFRSRIIHSSSAPISMDNYFLPNLPNKMNTRRRRSPPFVVAAAFSSFAPSTVSFPVQSSSSSSSLIKQYALPSLPLKGRTFASSSTGTDANNNTQSRQPSADELAKIRQLAENIAKNVEEGIKELQSIYGNQHTDKLWMTDYYHHKQHKYLVPALSLACTDQANIGMPTIAAKNTIFYSHILRQIPDTIAQTAATLSMTPGIDVGLLYAIMHQVGTPVSKTVCERLGASIRRSNNRGLIQTGQHIAMVPVTPVNEWSFPWEQANELHNAWEKYKKNNSSNALTVQPWEVAGIFLQARDMLDFHDWLLVSSTTIVESLWGAFYATGNRSFLQRLCDIASEWHEWSGLPDSVNYIANIETPLPENLRNKSTDINDIVRNVRAQVSRVALWSLLHHSRRHTLVTSNIIDECTRLIPYLTDADIRNPELLAASGLTEKEAQKRLEVFPPLVHLLARTRLDNPEKKNNGNISPKQ